MKQKPLMDARNLILSYQGRKVLDNVSLQIMPGEFVTIVGPNGAGKTSLLRLMLGTLKPDKGAITRREKMKVGYLPQRVAIDPLLPMTVRRFLMLVDGATENAIHACLKEVEISADRLWAPMQSLSGGELQRIWLARALLANPDILVLDEPAQNLDVQGQLLLYRLFRQIHTHRKCAILMVSHDVHLVMASTNRVVCLFHHVCCTGTPEAVSKDPAFVGLFGKDMARMLAIYHHDHDHAHEHEHTHG